MALIMSVVLVILRWISEGSDPSAGNLRALIAVSAGRAAVWAVSEDLGTSL